MELAEIIRQFSFPHLRGAYIELAHQVYDFPRDVAGWADSTLREHENRWEAFRNIQLISQSNSVDIYATEIEKCLETINEARAAQMLSENNKTKIQIDNKEHLHCAVVLSLISTEALEEVAIANNIVIPDESESGFRSFIPGVNKDTRRWALIKKMAEEMSNPISSGRHLFCPQCEIDIPSEADYCMSCGRERPQVVCPKCEAANPPQAKFCMGCGEER